MRIVSWNCNGRFRDKIENILSYNADLYVIQESENRINIFNSSKIRLKHIIGLG